MMVGGGVGWGLQSHFRVQPNNCVEVVLRCVVVGVVTIYTDTMLLIYTNTAQSSIPISILVSVPITALILIISIVGTLIINNNNISVSTNFKSLCHQQLQQIYQQ